MAQQSFSYPNKLQRRAQHVELFWVRFLAKIARDLQGMMVFEPSRGRLSQRKRRLKWAHGSLVLPCWPLFNYCKASCRIWSCGCCAVGRFHQLTNRNQDEIKNVLGCLGQCLVFIPLHD